MTDLTMAALSIFTGLLSNSHEQNCKATIDDLRAASIEQAKKLLAETEPQPPGPSHN